MRLSHSFPRTSRETGVERVLPGRARCADLGAPCWTWSLIVHSGVVRTGLPSAARWKEEVGLFAFCRVHVLCPCRRYPVTSPRHRPLSRSRSFQESHVTQDSVHSGPRSPERSLEVLGFVDVSGHMAVARSCARQWRPSSCPSGLSYPSGPGGPGPESLLTAGPSCLRFHLCGFPLLSSPASRKVSFKSSPWS